MSVVIVLMFIVVLSAVIYMISLLQDLRDVIDVLANPFLFEVDSPLYDILDKKKKTAHKTNAKKVLKKV